MLVEKTEIHHYIPQRPPMVMVDSLHLNDESKTISGFQITDQNIFCSEGCFVEAGLIENMAQTAALRAGYEATQKNEKVKVGFIGAVKNLKIHNLPIVGANIETITVTNTIGSFTLVKANVYSGDELIAESEMSIFTQE